MVGVNVSNPIRDYLDDVQNSLRQAPEQEIARVIEQLLEANRARRHIYVMGNGGSAATASHFACDLGKGAIVPGWGRFKVVALTDNVPLMTAWANDTSYANIFAQQLEGLIEERDVVIGFSGSGNSANVLSAMRVAREHSAVTIGLTGFDGGQLKDLVDICVLVPSFCMEQVEDVHLTLAHLICTCIRQALREGALPRMIREWPLHQALDAPDLEDGVAACD
jgi:D-sedoheptulose 7-phosphate isomerase